MIRSSSENDIDNCLYQGRRYPPDHRNKYELTGDFWYLLTFRFVIVLAFEVTIKHSNITVKHILLGGGKSNITYLTRYFKPN